jgi:hypothetical protein
MQRRLRMTEFWQAGRGPSPGGDFDARWISCEPCSGFPLPVGRSNSPLASIAASWERRHGSPAHARLHEYLVRKIRQWRPDVILTEPIRPRGEDELAQLINQTVLSAVEAAADPLAETDQALVTGLTPWTVKKVFSFEGPDQSRCVELDHRPVGTTAGQFLGRPGDLGPTIARFAAPMAGSDTGFRLLQSRLPGELGRQDFFSGIPMQPGSAARRQLHSPPPKDMRSISRLIQQRRNIEQLMRYASASSQHGATWLGQVENLIRDLDAPAGAQVLFESAQSLQRSGNCIWPPICTTIAAAFPDDPLCEAAAIWLIQFSSSSEARWAFRRLDRSPMCCHPSGRRRWCCRPGSSPPVTLPRSVLRRPGKALDKPR